ncbi:hypothetical protein ElyMa_003468900 [Elysia marginata]|uniref:Uncharacterized protein n=1 Tax=Elysia marginata TaxID=1093978 RepID=A0AAV4EAW9_9GAST|nr:hypothetical protein ElyMa_003468900 [Elysia marginata]
MAFNLLANLTRSSPSTSNSSPVDAKEGELDESDIENGGEEEEEGSGDECRPSNAVTSHRSRSRSRPRPTVEETEIDDTESVVYCTFSPICSTCQTTFKILGPQKSKRKKKA